MRRLPLHCSVLDSKGKYTIKGPPTHTRGEKLALHCGTTGVEQVASRCSGISPEFLNRPHLALSTQGHATWSPVPAGPHLSAAGQADPLTPRPNLDQQALGRPRGHLPLPGLEQP